MEAPRRIQLSRAKGWRMPPNTVKVDRSTDWGNPFVVEREAGKTFDGRAFVPTWRVRWAGRPHAIWSVGCIWQRTDAATLAVAKFREYCPPDSLLGEMAARVLRGKNLACWCKGEPCHADVLLELANAGRGDCASSAQPTGVSDKVPGRRKY